MLINSSTDPPARPPTKTTTLDDERPHSRGAKSLFSKYERVKDPDSLPVYIINTR